ncbi:portal protein [Oceanicaulis sp. HTCC2633]|uniref:phage portal protein n=1 Tax=Oceanicaulis sp. HTCC2633 TaxID=314254 RepID=UPI0000669A3F|nr:phage portal protein [Oceanicaulis sp. HTCC2633]EAP89163.1 portal protein [Oceanicaulis sp. HTCC2633]
MSNAIARQRVRKRRADASSRPAPKADSLMVNRMPRRAHAAGDPFDTQFAGSFTSHGSSDADWLGDRLTAVARIRDVIRNEPLAASGVEQKLSLLVGEGWQFQSAPDADVFGLDPASEEYEALARSIEKAWRRWASDPLARNDWEERLPWDLQLDLLARNYIAAEGEAVALILFDAESETFGTRLQVIDPDRLAQPAGWPDGAGGEIVIEGQGETYTALAADVRAGIARDDRGRPIAYHILDAHPHDIGLAGVMGRFAGRWYPVRTPGFETDTRPCVLHVFKQRRAGQSRGISDFVAALGAYAAFRDMGEAERRARIINALVVAQYTSAISDPEALIEVLGAENASEVLANRVGYYEEYGVGTVAGSRVIQPYPGDKLEWNSETRSANEWVDAMSFLALQAGMPLGLGYSMATRDFSRTTFSSARTEINDAFRAIKRERTVLRLHAVRPLRLAVLQEAYDRGELAVPPGAPSIWDAPAAYISGQDIGPGREYVDPVKEATGDRMEVENLSAAPSDIAARRGQNFDEVVARSARDNRAIQRAGLQLGDIGTMAASASGRDEEETPRK